MTLKHIRSPQDDTLYPISVEKVFVCEGQWVTAKTLAMQLKTKTGRTLQVSCVLEGTVNRILAQGAILKAPEPIFSIELDDSPSSQHTPPPKASTAQREEVRRPKASADQTTAEAAAQTDENTASPQQAGSAKPRRGVMIGIALVVCAGIAAAAFLKPAPNPQKPATPTGTSGSAVAESGPTSWINARRLKFANQTYFSGVENGRALALDTTGDGEVLIAGEQNGRGFFATYDATGGGMKRLSRVPSDTDTVVFDTEIKGAIVLKDAQFGSESIVLFTPKTLGYPSSAFIINAYGEFDREIGPFQHVLAAKRAGDWNIYLSTPAVLQLMGQKVTQVMLQKDDQFTNQVFDGEKSNYFDVSSYTDAQGRFLITAVGTELPEDGAPRNLITKLLVQRNGSEPKFVGVQKIYSAGENNIRPISGPTEVITATGNSPDEQQVLYGSLHRGQSSDPTTEGAYYFGFNGNARIPPHFIIRSDGNQNDGTMIKAIEPLADGGFALLLREARGAPYSAIVRLDRAGNILGQWTSDATVIADIVASSDGLLHVTGEHAKDDAKYPFYGAFPL